MKRGSIIIACSGGKHIGRSIARKAKCDYAELIADRFPDTELKIRLPVDVKRKNVYFVQSFYPSEKDINDKLVEVLFAAYTAKELGARRVILIAPYLAYLREDKRFERGEAISAKILRKLFRVFNRVYVVEPHLHRFRNFSQFFPNAIHISLREEVAEYIKKNVKRDFILVGPDSESEQWVEPVAHKLKARYIILSKKRFSARKVKVSGKQIKNEKAVIIDDIISTGQTLIEASKLIKAKEVWFIGMHGLFSENALSKLRRKGKIVVSNSIPSSASKLDCSNILSQLIR